MVFTSLPYGDVDDFIPGRVVGAIWPPVIPYIPLLIKIIIIFSLCCMHDCFLLCLWLQDHVTLVGEYKFFQVTDV